MTAIITDEKQLTRTLTYAELDALRQRSFEDGQRIGYEHGYRMGRLDLLDRQIDAQVADIQALTRETAACTKCFQRDQLINCDYCEECKPDLSSYNNAPLLRTDTGKKPEKLGNVRF